MNKQIVKLAAIQTISGPDVAANLADVERLLAEAAAQGVKMALLPEYFACISADESAKLEIREEDGTGPLQTFLADAARRHGLWIIGGTIPLVASDAQHVRNSTLVFDDKGQRVARYDKLHLFNFQRGNESYDEARTIERGSEVVTLDTPFGKVGFSVCYDLRFPEFYRRMGVVDLIVVPAAFTETTGRAPLGNPLAGEGHRKPVLCAGRRAGGRASQRTPYLRPQHARRPVGRDRLFSDHGSWRDRGGIRPRPHRFDSREPAGTETSYPDVILDTEHQATLSR